VKRGVGHSHVFSSSRSRVRLVLFSALAVTLIVAAGWRTAGRAEALTAKTHTTHVDKPSNALEVVSAGEPDVVTFGVCPQAQEPSEDTASSPAACPSEATSVPYLAGETTLLVRLKKAVDPMLTARFVPEGSRGKELLCDDEQLIFLEETPVKTDCSFEPVEVKGTNVIALQLGFRIPASEPPASIAGKLILGLDGREEGSPVSFSGALGELKNVAVNPTMLTLDSSHAEGEVTLAGPDVVGLLRSFALGPSRAILRDGAGDTTTATVHFPTAEEVASSGNPNLAKGKVTLDDDDPPAGKYTGKLLLSHASPAGPSVEIELHSHKSRWLMFLFVFLGIVSVGLVTRMVTLATRRSMLLEALNQSVDAYHATVDGETKSWDLTDLLGEQDPAKVALKSHGPAPRRSPGETVRRWMDEYRSPYTGARLQGLSALEKSINGARSSTDLDEDADRTLDMIARIQRWLRVEPVARLLTKVSGEKPQGTLEMSVEKGTKKKPKTEHKTLRWDDSQVYLDTLALLDMVKREPADASKADDLVGRLLDQARWHHEFASAWSCAVKKPQLAPGLIQLDEGIKAEKVSAGTRTPEQWDVLEARLRALVGQPPEEKISLSSVAVAREFKEPEVAGKDKEELGLTPVDWDASPNLFTGWATLDGPSYGQLVRRAATSSRTVYRQGGFFGSLIREIKAIRPADAFWTLAILVFASAAYGVSNYGDTWGSCEDLAKAYLAGATGAAAVEWAALPIFRSARIRSSKAK
jgi:hypothetical protein